MTVFTDTWNAAFEATPADTEVRNLGASRMRQVRAAVGERLVIDHSWAGDGDDGTHKQITFLDPLGADPSTVADQGYLYTKNVSAVVELFWKDESGNVKQITSLGNLVGVATDGELRSVQVFTADGTYTKPAGLVRAMVEVVSAGGGSGGCGATAANSVSSSGGGGGGGYSRELLEASAIGATETVTIGAGGIAGASGNNAGGAGGTTSFGALLSATGGSAGGGAGATPDDRNGGAGGGEGVGSGGDIDGTGTPGGNGLSLGIVGVAIGGKGGSSIAGGGGRDVASSSSSVGDPGGNYGAGASGAALGFSQSAGAGSAGTGGLIIVMEYF